MTFGQLNGQQQNNTFGEEDGPLTFQHDSAQISMPRYLTINGWQQCLEQWILSNNMGKCIFMLINLLGKMFAQLYPFNPYQGIIS